jgi:hypothetical protein
MSRRTPPLRVLQSSSPGPAFVDSGTPRLRVDLRVVGGPKVVDRRDVVLDVVGAGALEDLIVSAAHALAAALDENRDRPDLRPARRMIERHEARRRLAVHELRRLADELEADDGRSAIHARGTVDRNAAWSRLFVGAVDQ